MGWGERIETRTVDAWRKDRNEWKSRAERAEARVVELEADRDHWKANHDHQVAVKQRVHGLYQQQRTYTGEAEAQVVELSTRNAEAEAHLAWAWGNLPMPDATDGFSAEYVARNEAIRAFLASPSVAREATR